MTRAAALRWFVIVAVWVAALLPAFAQSKHIVIISIDGCRP